MIYRSQECSTTNYIFAYIVTYDTYCSATNAVGVINNVEKYPTLLSRSYWRSCRALFQLWNFFMNSERFFDFLDKLTKKIIIGFRDLRVCQENLSCSRNEFIFAVLQSTKSRGKNFLPWCWEFYKCKTSPHIPLWDILWMEKVELEVFSVFFSYSQKFVSHLSVVFYLNVFFFSYFVCVLGRITQKGEMNFPEGLQHSSQQIENEDARVQC
jgi:hypothetical protein